MKKNIINLCTIFCLLAFLSGCATFGDEGDWDEGDWYGLARPGTVAFIKQQKLILEKYENSNPIIHHDKRGRKSGLYGIVANLYNDDVNIKIKGPEKQSHFLSPGQQIDTGLIPGNYEAFFYVNNKLNKNTWVFSVGNEKHTFMGKECHWYVGYK